MDWPPEPRPEKFHRPNSNGFSTNSTMRSLVAASEAFGGQPPVIDVQEGVRVLGMNRPSAEEGSKRAALSRLLDSCSSRSVSALALGRSSTSLLPRLVFFGSDFLLSSLDIIVFLPETRKPYCLSSLIPFDAKRSWISNVFPRCCFLLLADRGRYLLAFSHTYYNLLSTHLARVLACL